MDWTIDGLIQTCSEGNILESETDLEDKPADRTPGDPGPAGVTDDVALRTLVHWGPRRLETDGTLQLVLHVETLVHGGGPGEGTGTRLSLTCLTALLTFIFLLLHLRNEEAELVTVFLHCFLPDSFVVVVMLVLSGYLIPREHLNLEQKKNNFSLSKVK